MRFVFGGHACVRLEHGDDRLVIDPGTFAAAETALLDATGVLVTHVHPDHIDPGVVVSALDAHPHLSVWGPPEVHDLLAESVAPGRVHPVRPGDTLRIGAARVDVGGGQHAQIHPRVPRIGNRTYTVRMGDVHVHHPGDSFDVPDEDLDVLCLPVAGPWLSMEQVIDVSLSASARVVVPVHDASLSGTGRALVAKFLDTGRLGGEHVFRRLEAGESFEL